MKKNLDNSGYGKLLRVLKNTFTSVNQWKPVYSAQAEFAKIMYEQMTERCPWIQDKNDTINTFIKYFQYKKYLEIGGQPSAATATFNAINCEMKECMDPAPAAQATYELTSDDFFDKFRGEKKYDIVFIDGWHEHQQVLNDINNSLEFLEDGGVIILHDMIPLTRDLEKDPLRTGTCWRAFADLRKRDDLQMHVLVPPWGSEDCLGFIKKGSQVPFEGEIKYDYDFLLDNLEELMMTIDVENFWKIYFPHLQLKTISQ